MSELVMFACNRFFIFEENVGGARASVNDIQTRGDN